MKKKTSPTMKPGQPIDAHHNSTAAQRDRLEEALRAGPVSTIRARKELDILAPAPRVFELRHDYGLNIQTHWKTEPTSCGKNHRVAEYVLFPGKWNGRAA